MLLMASMENKESDKEEAWFLDSGCSNHMCGTKEVFYDLDENFSETVKLGNNSSMVVKGKGYVRFQLNGISHIIILVCSMYLMTGISMVFLALVLVIN
jgi:hypothetical protein